MCVQKMHEEGYAITETCDILNLNRSSYYMLEKQGMRQSMSRVGRCIDNGPMEGFWGILKCEMYDLNHFETYEELVDAVGQFVHYYNYQRRQHRLNCLAPMDYRSLLEAA